MYIIIEMDCIVETRGLTKKYGNVYAVKDLNLEIERGETFGFLGPNGAGKTTTIAMLTGILRPTKGTVYLFGEEFDSSYFNLKRRVGVVPEYPSVYTSMSAYEYLSFFADLYRIKNKRGRIDELLKRLDLYEHKDRLLKNFSKGMRQKINISRALINDPEIIFLDEPIQGLDPAGVKEVRDLILDQKEKGKTIFISSHILSEIERICDVIGIINEGNLIIKGNMEELKRMVSSGVELEIELERITEGIINSIKQLDFIYDIRIEENTLKIKISEKKGCRGDISNCIFNEGGIILGMKENKVDLERIFIEVTKNG